MSYFLNQDHFMPNTKFAIAADSPETVRAGQIIAENGGNAVDVAVACALAASLTEVLMCSLGGSAFIAIKLPGEKPIVIDGADAMPEVSRIKAHAWREAEVPYGDGITVFHPIWQRTANDSRGQKTMGGNTIEHKRAFFIVQIV